MFVGIWYRWHRHSVHAARSSLQLRTIGTVRDGRVESSGHMLASLLSIASSRGGAAVPFADTPIGSNGCTPPLPRPGPNSPPNRCLSTDSKCPRSHSALLFLRRRQHHQISPSRHKANTPPTTAPAIIPVRLRSAPEPEPPGPDACGRRAVAEAAADRLDWSSATLSRDEMTTALSNSKPLSWLTR